MWSLLDHGMHLTLSSLSSFFLFIFPFAHHWNPISLSNHVSYKWIQKKERKEGARKKNENVWMMEALLEMTRFWTRTHFSLFLLLALLRENIMREGESPYFSIKNIIMIIVMIITIVSTHFFFLFLSFSFFQLFSNDILIDSHIERLSSFLFFLSLSLLFFHFLHPNFDGKREKKGEKEMIHSGKRRSNLYVIWMRILVRDKEKERWREMKKEKENSHFQVLITSRCRSPSLFLASTWIFSPSSFFLFPSFSFSSHFHLFLHPENYDTWSSDATQRETVGKNSDSLPSYFSFSFLFLFLSFLSSFSPHYLLLWFPS